MELTPKAGTQPRGARQLGSKEPMPQLSAWGMQSPCWTTLASGAQLGKGRAQCPQVAKKKSLSSQSSSLLGQLEALSSQCIWVYAFFFGTFSESARHLTDG